MVNSYNTGVHIKKCIILLKERTVNYVHISFVKIAWKSSKMLGGSVLWFRHGLRLHDNPSLHSALEDRSVPFFPMFIFDGETAGILSTITYIIYLNISKKTVANQLNNSLPPLPCKYSTHTLYTHKNTYTHTHT